MIQTELHSALRPPVLMVVCLGLCLLSSQANGQDPFGDNPFGDTAAPGMGPFGNAGTDAVPAANMFGPSSTSNTTGADVPGSRGSGSRSRPHYADRLRRRRGNGPMP